MQGIKSNQMIKAHKGDTIQTNDKSSACQSQKGIQSNQRMQAHKGDTIQSKDTSKLQRSWHIQGIQVQSKCLCMEAMEARLIKGTSILTRGTIAPGEPDRPGFVSSLVCVILTSKKLKCTFMFFQRASQSTALGHQVQLYHLVAGSCSDAPI